MIVRIVSLLSALLFFLACSNEKKMEFDVVVQNATIIHLETGTMDRQDVFIKDGRISNISTSYGNPVFESKNTIDATGKYIVPGFWDNHVHFRGGESLIGANKNFLKLFLAHGITTVRDAGGDLSPSVLAWRKQIRAGSHQGPRIFTAGPKIDGPNATWAGSLEVSNREDILKALDSLQKIKVDFVKLYDSQITAENYLETLHEAEKRGLITSGHMPFTVELGEAIAAGIDAIEHLYYIMKGCSDDESEITQRIVDKELSFWQAMPLLLDSYNESTTANTFQNLKQHGVYVVPTLHIGGVLSYLDQIDHSTDDYLRYMGTGIIETYKGRIERAANASVATTEERKNLDAFFGELAKSLHDAGVGLLAGSDCGAFNAYIYPGISLHRELYAMVESGIPTLDALRTSAPNGAKFLKQDADFGSISKGKVSDLVLLDANPLDDISNTQKIYSVIVGNTVYTKNMLQEMLEAARQNY